MVLPKLGSQLEALLKGVLERVSPEAGFRRRLGRKLLVAHPGEGDLVGGQESDDELTSFGSED